jgi:transposase InsO family protein
VTAPDARADRKRPTRSEREAAVVLLRRAAGPAGQPLTVHVRDVADRLRVDTSSVWRWLRKPGDAEEKARKQFVVTLDHLAVVAQEQNAKDAHAVLVAAGLVECSYPTFARALRERTDPALVAAAYKGHKGFVNSRVYLRFVAPHRGHTLHFDHTKADVWVWPSHKHALPVRPWITVVVDSATGYVLALIASAEPINAEQVAAVLAQAVTLREEHGSVVGGLPAVMVFDNAAEHHAAAIQQGAARLGIIPSPTEAYSPWQNGKAERVVGLVNQKLAAKCPAATAAQAGTGRTGAPRFVAADPAKIAVGDALTWRAFEVLLEALRVQINTQYQVQRLGGLTRSQAWAADETVLAEVEAPVVAQSMLKATKTYAVNGDGIHFASHTYVAPEMTRMRGQWVKVRHFPSNTDWIEVFGLDDEHLFRAFDTDRLSHGQKAAYNAARRTQDADNRALQAGVVAHRRHLAAALNDLAGQDTPGHTVADAVDAVEAARGQDGDTRAAAAARPALPRAGRPAQRDADAPARTSAVARLAALNAKRAIEAGTAGQEET